MKLMIFLGIGIFGIAGSYLGAAMDGGNMFGLWSIVLGTIGSFFGIWVGFKVGQAIGS